jgi:hypothetical protein
LWAWFGDPRPLTLGELELSFIDDLTSEELALARGLIRHNLRLRQTHVIEGTSALRDIDAVPVLRAMFHQETSADRRLTIAGALWKLAKDPVFIECLHDVRNQGGALLTGAHLLKVLWLDDERALDFLIDLLDAKDWLTESEVLGLLNRLEFGRLIAVPARELPSQRQDYRERRNNPEFRRMMLAAIHQWNGAMKNGR